MKITSDKNGMGRKVADSYFNEPHKCSIPHYLVVDQSGNGVPNYCGEAVLVCQQELMQGIWTDCVIDGYDPIIKTGVESRVVYRVILPQVEEIFFWQWRIPTVCDWRYAEKSTYERFKTFEQFEIYYKSKGLRARKILDISAQVEEEKQGLNGWIDVNTQLPDECTDVLFYNAGYKLHFIGRLYDKIEKTFWDQQADTHTKVSHWMNLPEPPTL